MTRFIQLNDSDGRPFLISEAKIEAILPRSEGCDVCWDGGTTPVKQDYDDICDAIINASQTAPVITVRWDSLRNIKGAV